MSEMNTSLRSKIREDHLTCMICFNRFTKPKALPCLHTFCEGCLRDYVAGRGYESLGRFPCPICRREIQLPPDGVQGFANNHLVASLSDTVDETPKVPPRPTPATRIDGDGRYSPIPQRLSPVPVPRPRSTSPTVPPRPHNLPPSSSAQAIGHIISGGIGAAAGAVNTAIADISGYLYKPEHPQKDPMETKFEVVEPASHGDSGHPGLYPQLSMPNDFTGPCVDGLLLKCGKYGPGIGEFLKPFGLSVGRGGEFLVSDAGGNRIFVFSNNGQSLSRFNDQKCCFHEIAVTKENHLLVAVSKSGSSIMREYTMEGKFIQAYGNFYRYDCASGITIDSKDHVAITNLAADNVLVFTDQRKFSTKFGHKGTGDKYFLQPQFITTTSKDYVIVSDTGTHCIKVHDMAGNFKRSFGGKGDHHGQFDTPLGVAADAEDNVIIADSNNFRVEIFNVKGQFSTTLVKDTNLIGPDVKPINVAITPRNNVAVLLFGTGFAEVRVYNWRPVAVCRNGVSDI